MRVSFVSLALAWALPAHAAVPPRTMLWAWERAEDLRFLAGDPTVGVAFFRGAVVLDGARTHYVPRRNPVLVPPGISLVAVVRVERVHPGGAHRTESERSAIVSALVAAANTPGVTGVQLDFDAVTSERAFHRSVLAAVRAALPAGTWFAMTALASWCTGDSWLESAPLPVDAVVPMAFAMGRDREGVLATLRTGRVFPSRVCRTDVGFAMDGPFVRLDGAARYWFFDTRPWDRGSVARVLEVSR